VEALSKDANVTYFPQFTPKRAYLTSLLSVYRRFLLNEFDVIHFNVVPNWINGSRMLLKLARSRGTPTILNIHGMSHIEHEFYKHERSGSRTFFGTRIFGDILDCCRDADRIVVNSEYMRANVVNWYGIESDKVVVIPNGIDLGRFSKCDSRFLLDGDPAILYLGLLSRMKGVPVLIEALDKLRSALPNVKLHLVGDGWPRSMRYIEFLLKSRGIVDYVIFHGLAQASSVPCYFKSADVCVIPSRYEGFGITVLEAMASGIPVVASDIGSFREIVSDGKDGVLFKSGDADALSKAILTLYEDSSLSTRLSETALKTVRKYSWEAIAAEYSSLYRRLCSASIA
jgi:glycosyltransferase involved in cell wall biosynthesis